MQWFSLEVVSGSGIFVILGWNFEIGFCWCFFEKIRERIWL
jgi:hypothetical protein